MPLYEFVCDTCETTCNVRCSHTEIANNWPTCPDEPEHGLMRRVFSAVPTIWKAGSSTKTKRGMPDVR